MSKGQITMELFSVLTKNGMQADWAMTHAMDTVAMRKCSPALAIILGEEATSALNADLDENFRRLEATE